MKLSRIDEWVIWNTFLTATGNTCASRVLDRWRPLHSDLIAIPRLTFREKIIGIKFQNNIQQQCYLSHFYKNSLPVGGGLFKQTIMSWRQTTVASSVQHVTSEFTTLRLPSYREQWRTFTLYTCICLWPWMKIAFVSKAGMWLLSPPHTLV